MGVSTFSGPIVSTAGFKAGASSQALTYIASGSVAVDPASIAALTSAETQVTITGAAVGDIVVMNIPASLETGLIYSGVRVSAANTVQIRISNMTAAGVDGISRSWGYTIIRIA